MSGTFPTCEFYGRFVRCLEFGETVDRCKSDPLSVVLRAPAWVAAGSTKRVMTATAAMHGVLLGRQARTGEDVEHALREHMCNERCDAVYSLFSVILAGASPRGGAGIMSSLSGFTPSPPTLREKGRVVREWTRACCAENVYESPCAICARLTFLRDLGRYDETALDLSCLDRAGDGVTRAERHGLNDAVCELTGPILYEGGIVNDGGAKLIDVCRTCLKAVRKMRMP